MFITERIKYCPLESGKWRLATSLEAWFPKAYPVDVEKVSDVPCREGLRPLLAIGQSEQGL